MWRGDSCPRNAGSKSTVEYAGNPEEMSIRFYLEQCCRATGPALALFFSNLFHVCDVGAGLGEDVVQVVAYADEGESLLQKLPDACGAEEKDTEDHIVLARVLDQLFGGVFELGRGVHM